MFVVGGITYRKESVVWRSPSLTTAGTQCHCLKQMSVPSWLTWSCALSSPPPTESEPVAPEPASHLCHVASCSWSCSRKSMMGVSKATVICQHESFYLFYISKDPKIVFLKSAGESSDKRVGARALESLLSSWKLEERGVLFLLRQTLGAPQSSQYRCHSDRGFLKTLIIMWSFFLLLSSPSDNTLWKRGTMVSLTLGCWQ